MEPIPLTSGAYKAKSLLANAQECINLYMESNPEKTKAPAPTTHYPRPGKMPLSSPGVPGAGRGLYRATNGKLYAVVNDTVYYIDQAWQFNPLGTITVGTNPTSMADNGETAGNDLVLVDGTPFGYIINMATNAFSQIVDGTGTFVGSDVVKYLSTFFLFNWPGTQRWYTSLADSVSFNALDVAAKSSYADNLATIGIRTREPWLFGNLTTEPWYLAGGADFQFEAIASTFVPYGIAGKYALTSADIFLFWLTRNVDGQRIIVRSEGYAAKRISTYAIEAEMAGYATVEDAVFSTYQIEGHTFVVCNFPAANRTWVYDLSTDQWYRSCWTDGDGNLNRDRALFYALAYDTIVALDWENGNLYKIDPNTFNDFGGPISYIRGFPHIVNQMQRVTHWALVVYMETGTIEDPDADEPLLGMRYSDDGGHTWIEFPSVGLGRTGEYQISPQFTQLGMARDRVYELFWSSDMKTALNGVFLDAEPEDNT